MGVQSKLFTPPGKAVATSRAKGGGERKRGAPSTFCSCVTNKHRTLTDGLQVEYLEVYECMCIHIHVS